MDLRPTADQTDFAEAVRRLASRAVRDNNPAEEVAGDYGPQVRLGELARLGLPGLTLPTAVGGSDASLLDLCLALEELGAGGITTPLVTSSLLVGSILGKSVDDPRVHKALSSVAAGSSVATIALLTAETQSEWSWAPTPAKRTDDGWSLTATFSQVPYAHVAEWLLLVADLEARGTTLVLLHLPELSADSLVIRPQRVIGGPPRASVVLDSVTIHLHETVSLSEGQLTAAIEDALTKAIVATTAHAVGACEGALGLAVTWAQQRHQFGRPIGSFQTVSSRCADIRIAIDPSRMLNWEAAWAVDEGRSNADEYVAIAKSYLAQAAGGVVTNAHQVLGALGYSVEHALHVHTRTIKAYQNAYGSAAMHLERVAQALHL